MTTLRQALNVLEDASCYYIYKPCDDYRTLKLEFEITPETYLNECDVPGNNVVRNALKHSMNCIYGTGHLKYGIPEVRKVLYNGPATIVFWEDNTKTVVKMQDGEEVYDPDKAFAMAVCKKLFGNTFNKHLTQAQKAFKKSCDELYDQRLKEFINDPESYINGFVKDVENCITSAFNNGK